jgi:LPS O-antigen subunit length determinant protein (WzzB/FepE family)
MKKNIQTDYEITFIELFQIIWQSKWKMVVVVVTSVLSTFLYQANQPKMFDAITKIVPITTFEERKYNLFNTSLNKLNNNSISPNKLNKSTRLNKLNNELNNKRANVGEYNPIKENTILKEEITKSKLLDLYIEVLSEKKLFKKAIHKFNLLNSSQYSNEQDYNVAVTNLASAIKIFKPIEKNDYDFYPTIKFSYHDPVKWKEVLKYVNELTNKKIQQNLKNEFQAHMISAKQERKNSIEDKDVEINNAITDYYRSISDRIEYLAEQAAIAEKLGIAKNTIEVQTFGNQNALLSNVKTDSPFYLRGYEAINKEIELMKLRTNNKAFIEGLVFLEKQKRAIIQDKFLERSENIFLSSPLNDDKDFYAASADILATKFQYKSKIKVLLISLIFGLIIGAIFIFIDNFNRFQKILIKK